MRTVVPFLVVCGGIGATACLAFFGCSATPPASAERRDTVPAAALTTRPQSAKYAGGKLDEYKHIKAKLTDLPGPTSTTNEIRVEAIRRADGKAETIVLKYHANDPCVKDNARKEILTAGDTPAYVALYDVENLSREALCPGESYSEYDVIKGLSECDKEPNDTKGNAALLNGRAIAFKGYVDFTTGEYHEICPDGTDCLSLACTTGVLAKCVHWGYPPWAKHYANPNEPPGRMVDMSAYFRSCVHGARAHYCAGRPSCPSYTCEATLIDMFDDIGIQYREHRDQRTVESAWSETGLTCFNHPRFTESWPDCANTTEGHCSSVDLIKKRCDYLSDDANAEAARTALLKQGAKIGILSEPKATSGCVTDHEKCPK